ncbi:response regulator, partial [Salipiger sp. HF18]|nr:response regulator [Salipiger sp. HF18]
MTKGDLSQAIGAALPYLRRYARALTGSQTTGDNYAAATLEAILADRSSAEMASSPKVGMFRVFHGIWATT